MSRLGSPLHVLGAALSVAGLVAAAAVTSASPVAAAVTEPYGPVTPPPARTPAPAPGHHLMMDRATTPSATEMKAWQDPETGSPYRAIAVYIPVTPASDNRHDKAQTNLDSDWVNQVLAGRWQVLPTYVGLQAPCPTAANATRFRKMSGDAATARSQGASAARDAASAVRTLGIPATAPVVYDLEAYTSGNARCSGAVKAFFAGWTTQLHGVGLRSGVYGSRSSTITDVTDASTSPAYPAPDVIWEATWNGRADTTFSTPPPGMWEGRRLNQFSHDVSRSYGGYALTIDENAVQDSVWDRTPPRLAAPTPPRATTSARVRIGWRSTDPSGVASYQVRIRRNAGRWQQPAELRRTTSTARTFTARPGERWCVVARATDRVGNTSAWSTPRCTTRFRDDRSLRAGRGWTTVRGGYLGSATKTTRRHAVLRGPRVSGRYVGVMMRGRGTVDVLIGGRKVGEVHGRGTKWVALPETRSGGLALRTQTRRLVVVDGFVVTP